MRHAEFGAEHIADAVARAHRHAGGERPGGKPGADLAIHPRVEIASVGLHARQPLRQHRKPLQRLRVAVRVGLARADALDAMVDGADAGRQKQPFRRVHGKRRIEDHRARNGQAMRQHLLHFRRLVGDAGDRGKLAAGDRGRHADLPHRRRVHRRRDATAGADPFDAVDVADIVGEAKLHRLGAVGDRAAADGHDQVGLGARGPVRSRRSPHRAACAAASRQRCRRSARQARGGCFRSRRSRGRACR